MASKSGHPAYPPRGRSGSPPSPSPRCRDIRSSAVPPLQLLSLASLSAPVVQSSYGCPSGILSVMPVTPNGHLTVHGTFSACTLLRMDGRALRRPARSVFCSRIISWPAPSLNHHHLASNPNGHFSRIKDQTIINEIRGFLLCRLKNSHPDQTLISDVFVRGVTGGECKPGSIAQMMINRARIQC